MMASRATGKAARAGVLIALVLLAGCGRQATRSADKQAAAPPDLETAAIAAGIVTDPDSTDITGLYARDTDRICVVPDRLQFHIGAYVDYGPGQSCSGTGTVSRSGETLHVRFDGVEGCEFDAKYDGDLIAFPGRMPDACAKLCTGRASFAALAGSRLSNAPAEASTLRNAKGKLLCPG